MNKRFWVEVRISYDGAAESGENIHLTETWLVRAATFAEAEARAVEAVSEYENVCNVDVETCTKRNIAGVWVGTTEEGPCKWYKVRCETTTTNEKTGKEKRMKREYLICVPNMLEAYGTLFKCLADDYDINDIDVLGINLTSITEILSNHE